MRRKHPVLVTYFIVAVTKYLTCMACIRISLFWLTFQSLVDWLQGRIALATKLE